MNKLFYVAFFIWICICSYAYTKIEWRKAQYIVEILYEDKFHTVKVDTEEKVEHYEKLSRYDVLFFDGEYFSKRTSRKI